MGGYDDVSIGAAVPQILAETEAQGVKHVIWLTYPLNVPYVLPSVLTVDDVREYAGVSLPVLPSGFQARTLYSNHNLVLYLNSLTHPSLHLADWNTYSAPHRDWFGSDGIHLTAAGTMALASYLKAQLDQYVVIPPPPPPPTPPPPTVAETTTTVPPTTAPETTTTVIDTTTTEPTTTAATTTTT